MGLLTALNNRNNLEDTFHLPSSKNALIIFIRNPELGKVKTRLAATIGDKAALEIYKFLLRHTSKISRKITADKFIFYSEKIQENDFWDTTIFRKKLQQGKDLGERMENAFNQLLTMGYENVIIIGSDIYELNAKDIDNAFLRLKTNKFVIGPAKDGGYYLLGMKQLNNKIFKHKNWGTDTVFKDTMSDLKTEKVSLLTIKNDVDYFEDIKGVKIFQPFLV